MCSTDYSNHVKVILIIEYVINTVNDTYVSDVYYNYLYELSLPIRTCVQSSMVWSYG